MAKSQRVIDLEEGIAEAVATLDETDSSRIGLIEAIDGARATLAGAYGVGFENAVSEYLSDDSDDDETEDGEDDDEDE